ncbi:MAG: VWA domain-containing protein [Bryobacteraceae bacterium]
MRTIALVAVAGFVLSGQQAPVPAPSDQPSAAVFRVTTTLVQVDAVVTDSKGRQVTTLQPDDFEIVVDGKPQKITHFSYVNVAPEAPPVAKKPMAIPELPGATPPLRPEEVRRTIVLMVDDLALTFESMAWVRYSLTKFVSEQMQPGDLVAVCRTGAGAGTLQQFTSDKRLLTSIINRLRWNFYGRSWLTSFDDSNGTAQPGRSRPTPLPGPLLAGSMDDLRNTSYMVGTLGAIDYVVQALREMPGRKSVVLFSDGLSLQTVPYVPGVSRGGDYAAVVAALHKLVDRANRAGAVIYTMDARGLDPLQVSAADRTQLTLGGTENVDLRRQAMEADFIATQQGLVALASLTGGVAYTNGNDLNGGLSLVLEDQRGYYLIGYSPHSSTFEQAGGAAPFHRIKVRVKTKGLTARSRTGFFGATDEQTEPKKETPAQQLRLAMLSPFNSAAVHLRLTPLYTEVHGKGPVVRNLLHIDPRDLQFNTAADGSKKAKIDVLAMAFGADDRPLALVNLIYQLEIPGKNVAREMRDGFVYKLDVGVPKPGAYQIRAAVRDEATSKVGSASQYIEIPDVRKRKFALASIILESERREGDSEALYVGAAKREFRSGSDLEFLSMVESTSKNVAGQAPILNAQIHLVRDGKEVYSAPAGLTAIQGAGQAFSGKLKLGDFPAGDYYLQVVANLHGGNKKLSATQWTDFQILP